MTFVKGEQGERHRVWITPEGGEAFGLELQVRHDLPHLVVESLLETAKITHNQSVEVRISAIGFSDGTAWSGQMAQRNPKGGWMPLLDQP